MKRIHLCTSKFYEDDYNGLDDDPCRMMVKKNNVRWFENDTKIHYSVERIFTRYGEYDKRLLEQEGAFVDILRVVS